MVSGRFTVQDESSNRFRVYESVFGLEPQNIADRVKAFSQLPEIPTATASILRGMFGFTFVSLGGFAPWVFAGRWFYRNVGEAGLYAVCAAAFIGLSGPLLHRLIIGPGSLVRFYKIFSLAFLAYSVIWTIAWMLLHRATGGVSAGVIGSAAGMAAMGALLAWGFKASNATLKIIILLFVANAAGYFIGEWAYKGVLALKEGNALGIVLQQSTRATFSKAAWGLCYGLGFGAGIGLAFHACQTEARKIIAEFTKPTAEPSPGN